MNKLTSEQTYRLNLCVFSLIRARSLKLQVRIRTFLALAYICLRSPLCSTVSFLKLIFQDVSNPANSDRLLLGIRVIVVA